MRSIRIRILWALCLAGLCLATASSVIASEIPPTPLDNPLRSSYEMAVESDGPIEVSLETASWVLFEGKMYDRSEFEKRVFAGDFGSDVSFDAFPASVQAGYLYAFRTGEELDAFDAELVARTGSREDYVRQAEEK